MNALKDMLYYTHPFPNASHIGDKMYVVDTAYDRNSHLAGTIVDLKEGAGVMLNGRAWRTTVEGTYVAGHILNHTAQAGYNTPFVGLADAGHDHFCWGSFGSFEAINAPGEEAARVMLITQTQRSDGSYYIKNFGGFGHLTQWVPAAPWAHSLMPREEDSAATTAAKRQLAEKKWKLARAIAEMGHEGYQRGWTEQLKELHENEDLSFLPRPRLGIIFEGTVLVPTGEDPARNTDLPGPVHDRIRGFQSRTISSVLQYSTRPTVPVQVTLPLNTSLNPEEIVFTEAVREVETLVRRALGEDSSVTIGQHRLSYFISGLSNLNHI